MYHIDFNSEFSTPTGSDVHGRRIQLQAAQRGFFPGSVRKGCYQGPAEDVMRSKYSLHVTVDNVCDSAALHLHTGWRSSLQSRDNEFAL